ncbi:MAG: hypothetical protein C0391_09350 [Anaerolinea sp.]|nr:hypothetical protein [Anaerolinea sp.]
MFDFLAELFSRKDESKVRLTRDQQRDVDAFVSELITIGRKEDFLAERPGGAFNGHCHHHRTRMIGEKLHAMGGLELMWLVFYRVKKKVGKQLSDHLEYAWSGIGHWMA